MVDITLAARWLTQFPWIDGLLSTLKDRQFILYGSMWSLYRFTAKLWMIGTSFTNITAITLQSYIATWFVEVWSSFWIEIQIPKTSINTSLTSQVTPLRIFLCKMQLQSLYLSNFCHDVSVFSCVQVIDLTGVRVQIVQKWWVISSEGIVGTAYDIRIGVGTQESIKRKDYHQSPNLCKV